VLGRLTARAPARRPRRLRAAAPIRPDGQFDIAVNAAGTSIRIAGTITGGSLAGAVDLAVQRPDGVACTAIPQTLVGALAYPEPFAGETATFPGAPAIDPF
jgi:hypothetical protein